MSDIGSCFLCGKAAQYAHFFDESVGHFVVGGEPRMCPTCNDKLREMSIEERRTLFASFAVTPEPPTKRDLLSDAFARGEEFKHRGRA